MRLKDNNDPMIDPDINWAPLLASFVNFCNYKTIVEIGVQQGDTTIELCKIAQKIGGKVYGYDYFDEIGMYGNGMPAPKTPPIEIIQKKFTDLGFDEKIIKLTKVDTTTPEFDAILKKDTSGVIDFAFIDGCHSYEGIKNDFLKVYPLLSDEGAIVFHDTFSHIGPRKFILDLYKLNDGTYDIINLPFGGGPGTQPYCRIGMAFLVKRSFAYSCGGILNASHDYADIGVQLKLAPLTNSPIANIVMRPDQNSQRNIDNYVNGIYADEEQWLREQIDNARNKNKASR
jgi:hypothetical protein